MAKIYNGAGQGSGVSYTPDPTVNGPWTHTRPDIPLFKPGANGAVTPGGAGVPARPNGGSPGRGGGAGGMGGTMRDQLQAGFDQYMHDRLGQGGFQGVFAGMPAGARGTGLALGGAGRGNGGNVAPPIAPRPPTTGGPGPVPGGGAIGTPVTPGPITGTVDPNNPEPGGYGVQPGQMPGGRGPTPIFQPPGGQAQMPGTPGVFNPRAPIPPKQRSAIATALQGGGTMPTGPRRGL